MKNQTILFDINETVLNLTLLKPKFMAVFNDESTLNLWFSNLLHTSTVCSLTGNKSAFASLASDALENTAARKGVKLSTEDRDDILSTFANLKPHDDIKPALAKLRANGYKTIAFSNSSSALINKQIDNAGLLDDFDQVISVEETGSFKPDPKVYQYAAKLLSQPIDSLRLVATHDWDTHGALSAGMSAAYINRSGAPYHPQYLKPEVIANDMNEIVEQIIAAK